MNKRNVSMVIGAGRFGSSIATKLCEHNEHVLIVDKDENAFNHLDEYSGYVACFDALDNDALIQNGINECKMVVLATNSDDLNIYLADVCSYIFSVPKVFVKLKDSRKKELLNEKIEIICPFDLTIDDFNKKYEGELL